MDRDQPTQLYPTETLFDGVWEDGRPKRWPTVRLKLGGRPFDVYCDDPADVSRNAFGIPVVRGYTATEQDLTRGWMSVTISRQVAVDHGRRAA